MVEAKILKVFQESKLSRMEFAQLLGISNAVMSHLASGRNKASLDLVITLLKHFPKINPEWLILDIGEMYKSDIDNKIVIKQVFSKHIFELKDMNSNMLKKMDSFEKEINDLK